MSDKKAKWYEVLEPSYIGDRLYPAGERVQYEGEAGPNLRELSEKELRSLEKQDRQEDEPTIEQREQELNEREEAVAQREKDADERAKELGVEVPEGATKVELRELIKAKQ